MHTALGLGSMLLVALGAHLMLAALHRRSSWAGRRYVQLVVLAAPLASLGLGIGGLYHFAGRPCLLSAPFWDQVLGWLLPLGAALVALLAVGLGCVRVVLLHHAVFRNGLPVPAALEERVRHSAAALGVPSPRIFLRASDAPLALVCGSRRPTLVLSTWMIEQLDARELESVLTHELSHLARRDYPMAWLASVLRDAFFYLPTSRRVFRQIQAEKEFACDDLAVSVTGRPLALASALAKVWQQGLAPPTFVAGQALVESGTTIEQRIRRLLDPTAVAWRAPAPTTVRSRGLLAASLALVLITSLAVATELMGCGPSWVISRLF